MIVRMDHIGMSVNDLDVSIAFYRAVFGLDVIIKDQFGGPSYAAIMALDGAAGRAALLGNDLFQVEMFEFSSPKPKAADRQRPVSDVGLTHFCVEVSDIDFHYRELSAAGVVFHGPPVNFEGKAKAAYARDPDGNVIEFREPLSQSKGAGK